MGAVYADATILPGFAFKFFAGYNTHSVRVGLISVVLGPDEQSTDRHVTLAASSCFRKFERAMARK